jgi:two-component system chemotaxis response regulator CheB
MAHVPQQRKPIRVLLVDDSALALAVLRRILDASPDIEVVATARSGREALEMIPAYDPAVVCTDLHMPDMDGLELTRKILEHYPRPVLVVSASTRQDDTHNVFRVLEAGAIDVVAKPISGFGQQYDQIARELVSKIKVVSGVYVFRRRAAPASHLPPALGSPTLSPRIIVVGASTGGPQVLQRIFSLLPQNYPLPIICIQHIASGFLVGFADWLRGLVKMNVKIAEPRELPIGGVIYLPPEETQLEFDSEGRFVITNHDSQAGHAPSITVTMASAAGYYKGSAVGVLLTGMGNDGAEGMHAIVRAGGHTIVQNKESSTIFGMPKQAIDLGAAREVLGPEEIANKLLMLGSKFSSK